MLYEKYSQNRLTAVATLTVLCAVIAIMIFLTFSSTLGGMAVTGDVGGERGVVDLRSRAGFDYNTDLFLLNGEWEYYPNRLLSPKDFAEGEIHGVRYIQFPHYFKEDRSNFPDGRGYATYRTMVLAPTDAAGIGIFNEFQYGAYQIFLNGQLISESGIVSDDPYDHIFAYNGGSGYIYAPAGGYYEVIVQVQCEDHVNGGLNNNIIMGAPGSIEHYRGFLAALVAISGGATIVLAFYFLILFIRNSDKREYLNFAIISLCSLYFVLTIIGRGYAYYLTPMISSHLLYSLEHITPMLAAYFASIHVIKKNIKHNYIPKIAIAYTAFHCLLIAILPSYQVSAIRSYFSVAAMVLLVFAFAVSVKYTVEGRKRKESKSNYPILEPVSLLVLIIAALLNRLGVVVLIGFDFFPIGVILYCFMHIFILSGYYKKVDDDLLELTKTLEKRVADRTAALVELNRKVEAADSVKSEFLTRMSREIRTPMNAIVSISELFDTENLNETQRNYFQNIKETSNTILNLINDIMDFSRIEAGRLELSPTHFNLGTFVENINSAAKYSAQLKGLHYECVTEAGIPEVIYSDEVRMKQVVANILSNAVKYTREGSVKLNISAAAKDSEKMLLFTVTDTGAGMSKEETQLIFDAFMNPELGRRRGLKGTGLGMAICKKLMDMQKGTIEFISAEGKGTEVKLWFPLTAGDEALVENSNVKEKIYAKNAKILLVEDNTINVTVALDILAAHDIRPDVAKDGYKALSMVKEKDYDLVFMDQFLPGMDGIETTQRIRELGGKCRTLPIVAMTSNVVHGARDMLIFKGLSDYIPKPVDHNALNNTLIRWLPHDKISSALGQFGKEERDEFLSGLPVELVEITEINCNAALKNMDGSVDIFIGLLRRFTAQADDYAESLNEYLKSGDYMNYIIVVNGAKNLLYNIGAKACGDMAAKLERAANKKDEEYCREQNERFCEHLKWLSQRVILALPQQNENETAKNKGFSKGGGLMKLAGIMQDLSFDYSIGDCVSIDKRVAILKESSFGEEYSELISEIVAETNAMEYESAAKLCKKILNTLLNE
jgi:signal transduction histidine kinase/CheY-like chemotaxis protein